MASPAESKVDESEVTSTLHNHHHAHQDEEDEDQFDLDFPLTRQSSIYSLTLDEIQNTVCEPGKTFGSMNMDEFLNNIWSVEEAAATGGGANVNVDINVTAAADDAAAHQQQTSLQRQGSLSLPAPLCRKTVDEVWAEIHRDERRSSVANPRGGSRERKATMGEMTLEDFLIKAGVVREQHVPAPIPPPPVDESPSPRSVVQPPPHSAMPLQHNFYPSPMNGVNANLDGGYMMAPAAAPGFDYSQQSQQQQQQQQQMTECYGGPVNGNSYQLRLGSPVSPVSSDGFGSGHVENVGLTGSAETGNGGAKNGRKRSADGGVEKVVERRQRRMIKNRESAARSRARKQAYTVELEAELNMLKEENACLRADERRTKATRKQVILECMAEYARNNVEKTARSLRRANSAPW
uniref:Abscisic acid-insensitive 5 n=1 Tax=Gladiolus hybrid cultivar TaxID=263601 RepID=U5TTQ7_9ASPA|nr:abscisic acid-insensitive 5 [Gladiolus hybrid cultivar]